MSYSSVIDNRLGFYSRTVIEEIRVNGRVSFMHCVLSVFHLTEKLMYNCSLLGLHIRTKVVNGDTLESITGSKDTKSKK